VYVVDFENTMKINWVLIEDLCPYQGVYTELKHKERLLPVTCFFKRTLEEHCSVDFSGYRVTRLCGLLLLNFV
jgi:hypothetical protein